MGPTRSCSRDINFKKSAMKCSAAIYLHPGIRRLVFVHRVGSDQTALIDNQRSALGKSCGKRV